MKKCNVRSAIQSDFDDLEGYEIHHIFPGSRRKTSEKYGYLYKLSHKVHHDIVHGSPNRGLDLMLKQTAQRHFETHYGSRADFIREFGRSYLE